MADWRDRFRSSTPFLPHAHPDSPMGGTGPGSSYLPADIDWWPRGLPHPDAPGAIGTDWRSMLRQLDVMERLRAVEEARKLAPGFLRDELVRVTGYELRAVVDGIVPGLLMALGVVGGTTALGAIAGGAIGALLFGAGAVPGALIGGQIGFDVGVALLEYLGIAFLAAYIG